MRSVDGQSLNSTQLGTVLTLLEKMVRFSVPHPARPPGRLSRLRVKLLSDPCDNRPSIVRKINLLAGLHQLDIGFCEGPTVRLLQVLKCLLIVSL